jgi:hypothetical protein
MTAQRAILIVDFAIGSPKVVRQKPHWRPQRHVPTPPPWRPQRAIPVPKPPKELLERVRERLDELRSALMAERSFTRTHRMDLFASAQWWMAAASHASVFSTPQVQY